MAPAVLLGHATDGEVELRALLYEVQLAEVADQRSAHWEAAGATGRSIDAASERDLDRRVFRWLLEAVAAVFLVPVLLARVTGGGASRSRPSDVDVGPPREKGLDQRGSDDGGDGE